MTAAPALLANEAVPLHGLTVVEGVPELDPRSARSALDDAPQLVGALAAPEAFAAKKGVEMAMDSYDNTPDFAMPTPRM